MHQRIVLFSFELIQVSITNSYDPHHHILLSNTSESTAKVIKNGSQLRTLFACMKKMGVMPIAYTAKDSANVRKVLQAVPQDPNWILIDNDPNKWRTILANHAVMRENSICYGAGYSNAEGKEEIRMAVQSALNQSGKTTFLIIQPSPQEHRHLKKQGYVHLLAEMPSPSQLEAALQKMAPLHEKVEIEPVEKLISESDSLKQILENSRFVLDSDKKFLVRNIQRPKNSRSICSMVFKNTDEKVYIGTTDVPDEIGGKEHHWAQENKVVECCLMQAMGCSVLPHYGLIRTPIKHSLIMKYEKKEGTFVVRPYARNIKMLERMLNPEERREVFRTGRYKGREIQGIGANLLFAILFGQEPSALSKTVLSRLSIFEQQAHYQSCRISFGRGEVEAEIPMAVRLSLEECLPLEELHDGYWKEISLLVCKLRSMKEYVRGIFAHHFWEESKLPFFEAVMAKLHRFQKQFRHMLHDFKSENTFSIRPMHLSYLLNDDFTYFTRNQAEEAGYLWGQKPQQSRYVEEMKSTSNFVIYGMIFPLEKLKRWARQFYPRVVYVSFLTSKPTHYRKKLKEMKLESGSAQRTIFILDHCEKDSHNEDTPIIGENHGFKTIFIYRLQRPPTNTLPSIDAQVKKGDLDTSEDELFETIFKQLPRSQTKYLQYEKAIELWIQSKCQSYQLEVEEAFSYCRKLRTCINNKKNRLRDHPTDLLYGLPIHVHKQRVDFIHNIDCFLNAKYLQEEIISDRWNGTLAGQQLNHFKEWYPHMPNKHQISRKLIEGLKRSHKRYDILQLIKALEIEGVIGQCEGIINYPSVNLHYNRHRLIVRTDEGRVQLNQWDHFINPEPIGPRCSVVTMLADSVFMMDQNRTLLQLEEDGSLIPLAELKKNCMKEVSRDMGLAGDRCSLEILQTQYRTQYIKYKLISHNQLVILKPSCLVAVSVTPSKETLETHLLPITPQSSYQLQLYYEQEEVQGVYFSYINKQHNIEIHLFKVGKGGMEKCRSYELVHEEGIWCYGFNMEVPMAYSFMKGDDCMRVWELGEEQRMKECSSIVYEVEERAREVVGRREKVAVVSEYNYLKVLRI